MIRFFTVFSLIFLLACSVRAEPPLLFLHGSPYQGELMYGYATPGSTVRLNGEKLSARKDGWFLFGIGRDDEGTLTLSVEKGKAKIRKVLRIKPRKWRIQKVNGLPQNTVTPNEEEQKRIEGENKLVEEARKKKVRRSVPLCFSVPAKGRISSVYGSQRIINGVPGGQHNALDIAAKTGTVIRAPADGVVLLAHEDMLLTGKTVLMAHGNDLTTSYIHMSKILVKEGQKLKKGDKIGLIGMTGRANGPHLHWTVMWKDKRVDPQAFLRNSAAFCSASAKPAKKAKKAKAAVKKSVKKAAAPKAQETPKTPDEKADKEKTPAIKTDKKEKAAPEAAKKKTEETAKEAEAPKDKPSAPIAEKENKK